MEPENFNGKAGKVYIPSGVSYFVFEPHTLPLNLSNMDFETASLLGEANRELGRLDGLGHKFENPYLMLSPYLKKEAVSSTRIEGTRSSLSEILKYESESPNETRSPDIQDVFNYVKAMDHGVNSINENADINLDLILTLHKTLLVKTRGEDKEPGKIRTRQNWIGSPTSDYHNASFVPPEPSAVPSLMQNLLEYMSSDSKLPTLVSASLIHYQFETIHPFRDGNGRLGRILIPLYLMKKKTMSLPLLYMSPYFEKNDKVYRGLLLDVNQNGNYSDWIKFFLKGVISQSQVTYLKMMNLFKYRADCEEKVNQIGNSNSLIILKHLFENPFISVPKACKLLGKTFPTAKRSVGVLVELGILTEITGQKRNREYYASKILNCIESDESSCSTSTEPNKK